MKLLLTLASAAALSGPTRLPALAADKQLKTIFENNRKWVREEVKKDKDYFNRMASGQSPQILWIGCSDSRVPANRIMGLDAGEVFVARNVANQVIGTDMSMMSVIQYAVNVLKVPHIVICGHYDCGGVKASMENVDHVPPLENWLRNIRDTYRLNRQELDRIYDKDQRTRRLVELNTIEQAFAVFKTGVVQRRRVQTYGAEDEPYTQPRIHAVVFDPGASRRLLLLQGRVDAVDVAVRESTRLVREPRQFRDGIVRRRYRRAQGTKCELEAGARQAGADLQPVRAGDGGGAGREVG